MVSIFYCIVTDRFFFDFMQGLPEIRAIYHKVLLFQTAHIVYLKLILQDDGVLTVGFGMLHMVQELGRCSAFCVSMPFNLD
jgi:hypothetical protein